MTVEELISKLITMPQDNIVMVRSYEWEYDSTFDISAEAIILQGDKVIIKGWYAANYEGDIKEIVNEIK